VLTAVVTQTGASVQVSLPGGLVAAEEGEEIEVPENDLNPIAPEVKEMLWGFGSFVVLALLMRFVLFPRLKKGMDARYGSIRADHEAADAMRADAKGEVASYEAALAEVRLEAAARIEAARQTLEAERAEQLAVVNERIAQRKAAAAAEAEAARAAVQAQVHAAVGEVTANAVERAVGKRPADEVVQRAVADVMSAGVAR
jgi:F-type H+-transporting ATPase subunit b